MKKAAIVIVALSLMPAVAWAEARSADRCPPGQQDCTVYDGWGDEDVFADAGPGPEDIIRPRRGHGYERLIRVRTHFLPELVKSVENI